MGSRRSIIFGRRGSPARPACVSALRLLYPSRETAMDDLDRMFTRLVENTRSSYPEYLTRPFEVAELYQNLIPYRHNRRELGIETNQDYEMTLLRLLSGERGYLSGDPIMQDALRHEAASRNPDTSMFRAYATSYVSVNADAVRRLEQGATVAATDDVRLAASAAAAHARAPSQPVPPPAPAVAPTPSAPRPNASFDVPPMV